MKKALFLGAALAVASVGLAQAADLSRPAPVPMPTVLPAFTWGGAYIGATAGIANQRTEWKDVDGWYYGDPLTATLDNTGFALGVHAGYNYMVTPTLLIGIETDIAYNFGSDKYTVSSEPAWVSSDANWLGTTRLRLGYAFDRTLFYATGGLAYGNPSARWHEDTGAAWKVDGWNTGYTVGGGVEYAATNNWLIRFEALYYDLGSHGAKNVTPVTSSDYDDTDGYRMKAKMDGFTIRAGLSYKF